VELRDAILERLRSRATGTTICPSEAARAACPGEGEGWRELMGPVREVAFAMADRGELEVTQRGRVVDGRAARGPLRLRLPDGA